MNPIIYTRTTTSTDSSANFNTDNVSDSVVPTIFEEGIEDDGLSLGKAYDKSLVNRKAADTMDLKKSITELMSQFIKNIQTDNDFRAMVLDDMYKNPSFIYALINCAIDNQHPDVLNLACCLVHPRSDTVSVSQNRWYPPGPCDEVFVGLLELLIRRYVITKDNLLTIINPIYNHHRIIEFVCATKYLMKDTSWSMLYARLKLMRELEDRDIDFSRFKQECEEFFRYIELIKLKKIEEIQLKPSSMTHLMNAVSIALRLLSLGYKNQLFDLIDRYHVIGSGQLKEKVFESISQIGNEEYIQELIQYLRNDSRYQEKKNSCIRGLVMTYVHSLIDKGCLDALKVYEKHPRLILAAMSLEYCSYFDSVEDKKCLREFIEGWEAIMIQDSPQIMRSVHIDHVLSSRIPLYVYLGDITDDESLVKWLEEQGATLEQIHISYLQSKVCFYRKKIEYLKQMRALERLLGLFSDKRSFPFRLSDYEGVVL